MGTKTHNNYEDLITFTRASAGHALRPVSYGTELVANGTFDSDTSNWTPENSATLSIDNEKLKIVSSSSADLAATQVINVSAGSVYFLTSDNTDGDVQAYIRIIDSDGSTNLYDTLSSGGDGQAVVVPSGSTLTFQLRGVFTTTGQAVYFDNISVKEVTFDESDGTLTLFEHPDNIPRVEYDADGNRLGLLIEETRTNLIANSDFDAGVSQSGVTITANASESPDGLQNATSLDLTSSSGFSYFTVSVTAGTEYTWSWFAKAGTATAHVYAVYDTTNAAFVSREEYTLTSGQNYGNGWYRHTETFTAPTGCTEVRVYAIRGTTSSGSPAGVQGTTFVWGGQLEADAFASSIIRTTGATATRSGDVASIPTADFGYNHKEGTILVEFSGQFNDGGTGFPRPWEISGNNSSNDRVLNYISEASGNLSAEVRNGGTQTVGMTVDSNIGSPFTAIKSAFAFKADDFAATENGDTPVTDTNGSFTPSVPRDTLGLMAQITGGNILNGHMKSIKYYPRRLTNAQLQDLTS